MSLKSSLDPAEHIASGKALAPLRNDNVLIIGSGQMTHNLREFRASYTGKARKDAWRKEFTGWIHDQLTSLSPETIPQAEELIHLMSRAPHATWDHPRTEHLAPLYVAFGAAIGPIATNSDQCPPSAIKARHVYSQIVMGSMALDTYLFE